MHIVGTRMRFMPRECAFCPSTANITGERIWSDWILSKSGGRMIVKFRENLLMTEAVQWCGDNAEEIRQFIGEQVDVDGDRLTVKSSDGDIPIDKGDWIIRRLKGGFGRCKQPEMFKVAYEWLGRKDAT